MNKLIATQCMNVVVFKIHRFIHFSDINECESENGGCDQNCENKNGSYYCTCNGGYTLHGDEMSCDGNIYRYNALIVSK